MQGVIVSHLEDSTLPTEGRRQRVLAHHADWCELQRDASSPVVPIRQEQIPLQDVRPNLDVLLEAHHDPNAFAVPEGAGRLESHVPLFEQGVEKSKGVAILKGLIRATDEAER